MNTNKKEELATLFSYIKSKVDKLPISQAKKNQMLEEVLDLKKMTVDSREPRIALVGRRGAGKSSLINALFGKKEQFVSPVQSGTGMGRWLWYPNETDKKVKLLDSRGLGESEQPIEAYKTSFALDEVKRAFTLERPDVFLFLIKAKEADARIEEDLRDLKNLREMVKSIYDYEVPVICIITQVDELDPPHYKQVPLDAHPKKKINIDKSAELMKRRFVEAKIPLLTILPVSSYIEFDEDGNIEYDMRWNIDSLSNYLIEALPRQAQLRMARALQIMAVKKRYAFTLVSVFAGIAGFIGTEPIPIADFPVLTAIQGIMIMIIAYIADREVSTKAAGEFITALGVNVGVALVVREGVRAVVKLIPAAGNAVSGAVAGAVTFGIGQAAISFYIEGKDLEQAKEILKKTNKEFKAKRSRNNSDHE
ncbi:GTPase family protein [Peribacillus sp. SCS-155]|uniref:GTPase family protein n=1 Tax=Peribacillus sedimenti TaxID=3115297 RepID=UPI0039061AF9